MDLAAVAGLQEPEEQVDRPGLAAPGLRRGVPLRLAEEPVGVRGLDLPGEHARVLQELLHRGDLAADRAVRHAVGQPGQHVLGHQVLLIGRGLAGIVEGPRGPQVPDHSQRHAAPRLQQSRTRLVIAEDCTGIPTRIQGSASDTPARLSCHLTCDKARPAPARARTNCRQVQHTTPERRLAQRLTDHALGRGARLTQVQIERGGFWVLAQTQPGGRATERRLKQHGATRRCEVCKAAGAYQSGELTAPEALARAGWDRSNPVQRSLLLDIFGLPQPPEMPPADAR